MLTRKQRDLLVYITERIDLDGVSPSFEEMKEAMELSSKSGVHRLISRLQERGYIRRLENRARALEVLKTPQGTLRDAAGPGARISTIPDDGPIRIVLEIRPKDAVHAAETLVGAMSDFAEPTPEDGRETHQRRYARIGHPTLLVRRTEDGFVVIDERTPPKP